MAADADGWTVEDGETVVGLWDCRRCGHVGNSGLERRCTSCGAPREDDVAFYLPGQGQEEVITEAATLREAKAGPDWVCEHCGASNSATLSVCTQCGAPRGASDSLDTRMYAPGAEPHSDREVRGEGAASAAPVKARSRWTGGRIAAVVALVLVVLLPLLFRTRTVPMTVTALTWERTIAVEENRRLVEEGWSVPGGGRVLDRSIRIRSYHSVLDHYEKATKTVHERVRTGSRTVRERSGRRSNGNGTFTTQYRTRTEPTYSTRSRQVTYQRPVYRQVPVPGTWYRYEIWRWVHERDERAAGSMPQSEPYWPDTHCGAQEREGQRNALYRVSLQGPRDATPRTNDLPEDQWRRLHVGERHTVRMNAFGSVMDIQ